MLIILEGVDCAGKTTLANDLVDDITLRYPNDTTEVIHRGVPQGTPTQEYVVPLSEYVPDVGHHIICDRWHLGADVYGPIMRNDDGLGTVTREQIEKFLNRQRALLVLVEPPSAGSMLMRMKTRGEDYVNPSQALACLAKFRQVYAHSRLQKTKVKGIIETRPIIERALELEKGANA